MSQVININARLPAGDTVQLAFPLHPDTQAVPAVSGLVQTILESIERDRATFGTIYASDVLQALSIALVTRALMIEAPPEQVEKLVKDLLATSWGAAEQSRRRYKEQVGHA